MELATPGNTIHLNPGEYREPIHTVRAGEPDDPITITGPADAVIRPPAPKYDVSTLVNIKHNHFQLRGLTLDGLIESDRKFEDHEAWVRRCVMISPVGREDTDIEYLDGIVVEPARIGNAGGPLIQTQRFRNSSIGNFEVIGPAGMTHDRRVANHRPGHVREIVYIGSPESHRGDPFYEYDTIDRCRNIRIHHIDNSDGYRHNELVDVKLGSTNITVEYCTDRNAGHTTDTGVDAALDIKGNDCTIRWNDLRGCPIPMSFGSWAQSADIDGADWSNDNAVYGNVFRDFAAGPFRLRNKPEWNIGPASLDDQRVICGNQIERGNPTIEPFFSDADGFDGTVVDRRGEEEVRISVGSGPDGHTLDPTAVFVDVDTVIAWEWGEGDGEHSIVPEGDLGHGSDVPEPVAGPHSQSYDQYEIGVKRYACANHREEGARAAVVTVSPEDRYAFSRNACEGGVPSSDAVGHTGGDSPWA
jgi:plastocyanin